MGRYRRRTHHARREREREREKEKERRRRRRTTLMAMMRAVLTVPSSSSRPCSTSSFSRRQREKVASSMTTTRCANNQAPDLNDNTVEKNKKPEYKPQKPRKRKAKTGSPRPPPPPTAKDLEMMSKFDELEADGGVKFEVFARAKGPNQWFPVGPMVVKEEWMIGKELWNAEEPLKRAALQMYPKLAAAPAFGNLEYGFRRADAEKITEEEIRRAQGKVNPFDDVELLKERSEYDGAAPERTLLQKFNAWMNPYTNK